MGINGLWQFVKNSLKCLKIPMKSFYAKRIAIDAYSWFYVLRCAARSQVIDRTDVLLSDPDDNEIDKIWMFLAINDIIKWMQCGITPVLVYDGVKPMAKIKTLEDRTKIKNTAVEKLNELKEKALAQDGLLKNDDWLIEARKYARQINNIPKNSIEKIKNFFIGLGIPYCQAIGDGERAASRLCNEGIVAAVYSSDCDCLVHGAPIILRGPADITYDENGYGQPTFEIVELRNILRELELNENMFIDLCIMSGCDYNVNMKNIGFGRSLNLILEHESIDNLPKKYNIECLNHDECRELFSPIPSIECIESTSGFDVLPLTENLIKHLEEYGAIEYKTKIERVFKSLPEAKNHQHISYFEYDGMMVEEGERLKDITLYNKQPKTRKYVKKK